MPYGSDIYFAHAYVPPSKCCVAVLISLVFAEGVERPAGVYVAINFDGVRFREPLCVHQCRTHKRRAVDLPIQGYVKFTSDGVDFYVHRNIPCRIKNSKPGGPERIDYFNSSLPKYMTKLLT